MTPAGRQNRILCLLLSLLGVGLTWWAYAPASEAGFYLDDRTNILHVEAIHWHNLSMENVRQVLENSLLPRRWLANLSFAANHLLSGLDPHGYHVVNILLHLMVGAAVSWTSWLILSAAEQPRDPPRLRAGAASILAGMLFLVHPLQTQAVTYVVQRMAVLAALFGLLAFGLYLSARMARGSGRQAALLTLSIAAWIMAIGSKENAILIPLLILMWEWSFRRSEWLDRFKRWQAKVSRSRRVCIVFVCVFLVILSGIGLFWLSSQYVDWEGTYAKRLSGRDFTAWQRVLSQGRVQVLYLSLLGWPAPDRLNLDHDFKPSQSILDPPATLVAIAFWLLVCAASVWLVARKPVFGFPVVAYLVLHSLEAGPFNLELVFEHRMYLPLAAVAWFVAASTSRLRTSPANTITVVLLISTSLAAVSHSRNLTWSDPLTLYRDCVAKSPNKPRPRVNLASYLYESGRFAEARAEFREAVRLDPLYREARLGLSRAEAALNDFAAAEAIMVDMVSEEPGAAELRSDYADLLMRRGDVAAAIRELRIATRLAPDRAHFHHNLGVALIRFGDLKGARAELEKALELDPFLALSVQPLGDVYDRLGMKSAAIARYRDAVAADPANATLQLNLGTLLGEQGDLEGARRHLEESVRLDPESTVARNNLGNTYFQLGWLTEANQQYERSLALDPGNQEARSNLELLREMLIQLPSD